MLIIFFIFLCVSADPKISAEPLSSSELAVYVDMTKQEKNEIKSIKLEIDTGTFTEETQIFRLTNNPDSLAYLHVKTVIDNPINEVQSIVIYHGLLQKKIAFSIVNPSGDHLSGTYSFDCFKNGVLVGETSDLTPLMHPHNVQLAINEACKEEIESVTLDNGIYHVTFKQSSANTLDLSLHRNNLSPSSASLLIQPIQKTPTIKGFYYILDQGHRTPAIPWNATLDQLYAALHTLPTIEGINVTLTNHPIYTNGGRIISITFLPFNKYNTHEKLNIQSELHGEGVNIVVCEGNNNHDGICKDIPSHKGSMVSGHFSIINPTIVPKGRRRRRQVVHNTITVENGMDTTELQNQLKTIEYNCIVSRTGPDIYNGYIFSLSFPSLDFLPPMLVNNDGLNGNVIIINDTGFPQEIQQIVDAKLRQFYLQLKGEHKYISEAVFLNYKQVDKECGEKIKNALEKMPNIGSVRVNCIDDGETMNSYITFREKSGDITPLYIPDIVVKTIIHSNNLPLSGEFRIGYDGEYTKYLPINVNNKILEKALSDLPTVGKVTVEDKGCRPLVNNGCEWEITFIHKIGDLHKLSFDSSRIKGTKPYGWLYEMADGELPPFNSYRGGARYNKVINIDSSNNNNNNNKIDDNTMNIIFDKLNNGVVYYIRGVITYNNQKMKRKAVYSVPLMVKPTFILPKTPKLAVELEEAGDNNNNNHVLKCSWNNPIYYNDTLIISHYDLCWSYEDLYNRDAKCNSIGIISNNNNNNNNNENYNHRIENIDKNKIIYIKLSIYYICNDKTYCSNTLPYYTTYIPEEMRKIRNYKDYYHLLDISPIISDVTDNSLKLNWDNVFTNNSNNNNMIISKENVLKYRIYYCHFNKDDNYNNRRRSHDLPILLFTKKCMLLKELNGNEITFLNVVKLNSEIYHLFFVEIYEKTMEGEGEKVSLMLSTNSIYLQSKYDISYTKILTTNYTYEINKEQQILLLPSDYNGKILFKFDNNNEYNNDNNSFKEFDYNSSISITEFSEFLSNLYINNNNEKVGKITLSHDSYYDKTRWWLKYQRYGNIPTLIARIITIINEGENSENNDINNINNDIHSYIDYNSYEIVKGEINTIDFDLYKSTNQKTNEKIENLNYFVEIYKLLDNGTFEWVEDTPLPQLQRPIYYSKYFTVMNNNNNNNCNNDVAFVYENKQSEKSVNINELKKEDIVLMLNSIGIKEDEYKFIYHYNPIEFEIFFYISSIDIHQFNMILLNNNNNNDNNSENNNNNNNNNNKCEISKSSQTYQILNNDEFYYSTTFLPHEDIPYYINILELHQGGLIGYYYDNMFLYRNPYKVEINSEIDHLKYPIVRSYSSIRWIGKLKVEVSDVYSLYVEGEKGIRLYINHKLFSDHWVYPQSEYGREIYLDSSIYYDIVIEYYKMNTNSSFAFYYSSSTIPTKTIVPSNCLYYSIEMSEKPQLISNISNQASYTTSFAYGSGIDSPKSEKENIFFIQSKYIDGKIKLTGGDEYEVYIVDNNNNNNENNKENGIEKKEYLNVEYIDNGLYSVKYRLNESGSYIIYVKLNGHNLWCGYNQLLPCSPHYITAVPENVKYTKIEVNLPSFGSVEDFIQFNAIPKDDKGNIAFTSTNEDNNNNIENKDNKDKKEDEFELFMVLQSNSSYRIKCKVNDLLDGRYLIDFVPLLSGYYYPDASNVNGSIRVINEEDKLPIIKIKTLPFNPSNTQFLNVDNNNNIIIANNEINYVDILLNDKYNNPITTDLNDVILTLKIYNDENIIYSSSITYKLIFNNNNYYNNENTFTLKYNSIPLDNLPFNITSTALTSLLLQMDENNKVNIIEDDNNNNNGEKVFIIIIISSKYINLEIESNNNNNIKLIQLNTENHYRLYYQTTVNGKYTIDLKVKDIDIDKHPQIEINNSNNEIDSTQTRIKYDNSIEAGKDSDIEVSFYSTCQSDKYVLKVDKKKITENKEEGNDKKRMYQYYRIIINEKNGKGSFQLKYKDKYSNKIYNINEIENEILSFNISNYEIYNDNNNNDYMLITIYNNNNNEENNENNENELEVVNNTKKGLIFDVLEKGEIINKNYYQFKINNYTSIPKQISDININDILSSLNNSNQIELFDIYENKVGDSLYLYTIIINKYKNISQDIPIELISDIDNAIQLIHIQKYIPPKQIIYNKEIHSNISVDLSLIPITNNNNEEEEKNDYNITDTNIVKFRCNNNNNNESSENIVVIFDEIMYRNYTFSTNITIEELKKGIFQQNRIEFIIIKENGNNNNNNNNSESDLLCDNDEVTIINKNSSFNMFYSYYYSNNSNNNNLLDFRIISLGRIKSNLYELIDSKPFIIKFTFSAYKAKEYLIDLKLDKDNNNFISSLSSTTSSFSYKNIFINPTKPFGLKSIHNCPHFGFVGIPIEFNVFLYDKYSNPIKEIEDETNLILEITNRINNYTTDTIIPKITKIKNENNTCDYFKVKFVYSKKGHLIVKMSLEDKGLNVLYYQDQFTEYPILGNSYNCPIEFKNCKSTDVISHLNETKYGNVINNKRYDENNNVIVEDLVYSVSYYGYINIPKDDKYLFLFPSNNGVRITIDREIIYSKWIRYNNEVVIDNKNLTKGKHEIFVETRPFESNNKMELYFYWQYNNENNNTENDNSRREIIPENGFSYIKPIQNGNFIVELLPNELIYTYFMEYLLSNPSNEISNLLVNYTTNDLLNIIINDCQLKNDNILFNSVLFNSIYKSKCENEEYSFNSTFTDELMDIDLSKHYTEKESINREMKDSINENEVDLSYNECCELIGVQNKNENPGRRRRRH